MSEKKSIKQSYLSYHL